MPKKIEEQYAEEDEEDMLSQSSVLSSAPERQDFNSILDEFLDNYSTSGKRNDRVKKGKAQSGLEQLDEIVSCRELDFHQRDQRETDIENPFTATGTWSCKNTNEVDLELDSCCSTLLFYLHDSP